MTVRAIEDLIRAHNDEANGVVRDLVATDDGGVRRRPTAPARSVPRRSRPSDGSTDRTGGRPGPRQLPPPGILELEELLSSHLNTRVKVDLSSKRGKVVVEFATLEDLERIYKLMVGGRGDIHGLRVATLA